MILELEINSYKKRELYDTHLKVIKGIAFTYREIDIIACILHQRGEKKIASLLSISPRTIGAHVHNIMLKLGYSSREYIIDFIEKSGQISLIHQYYFLLLIQNVFEKHLIAIGKIIGNRGGITYTVGYKLLSIESKNILDQVKEHLKLANITLKDIDKINQDKKNNPHLLNDQSVSHERQANSVILVINRNSETSINYEPNSSLNFDNEENYYFRILFLFKKLVGEVIIDKIIREFNDERRVIQDSFRYENQKVEKTITYSFWKKITRKNLIILLVLFSFLIFFATNLKISTWYQGINLDRIVMDLPLLDQSTLLGRESVLSEMKARLLVNNNIKVIALVGIGGSGKTTIARQYARGCQKVPLIWEINCDTRDSIISSFKQLAYTFCKTPEEKEELKGILQIKEQQEVQKKLLMFLTQRIKSYSNWLIIYNNVKTFADIQQYFPYDADVWGNGGVIITTIDANIANNSYIPAENIIRIEPLTKEQKLQLFSTIIYNTKNYPDNQQSIVIDFLEKLPPFPLDISMAASYIRELNISGAEYLQYITNPKEEFIALQKTILNDIGEYNKTRYEIITLSVKHIIEQSQDFLDLLLLLSLIDADDIPKDLLFSYKDVIIVSQFIHELKKFSLITEKSPVNNGHPATLSIHSSTQEIILAYLVQKLSLKTGTKQILDISDILEKLITDELKIPNSKKISLLVRHVEKYLINNKWLADTTISNLYTKLGVYYFHLTNYKKANELLEKALIINKKYYKASHLKNAETSRYLGNVYRNLGKYKDAIVLHENTLKAFQTDYGSKSVDTILISVYLGSSYRHVGKYIEAVSLLEHAWTIYKEEYGIKDAKTARASAYLGNVYHDIGEYSKAKDLLELAFNVYREYYGKDNIKTAWVSVRLAIVYNSIGEYNKARGLIEQAISIYKHYNEDSIEIAWSLLHLSRTLIELENYKEAQKLLEKALIIYNENYGHGHIETARILNSLGIVYYKINNLDVAETFITKALNIFMQNDHPESFVPLKDLANVYLEKSLQEKLKGNVAQAKLFKQKAINYLNQAEVIAKTHLPANTFHINAIHDKIMNYNGTQKLDW